MRKSFGRVLAASTLVLALIGVEPTGAVTDVVGGPLGFHPYHLADVVDTTTIAASGTLTIDVAGVNVGMHTNEVSAVVLNVVSSSNGSSSGYLKLISADQSSSVPSSALSPSGTAAATTVTVPVNAAGEIKIINANVANSVEVQADVLGYYGIRDAGYSDRFLPAEGATVYDGRGVNDYGPAEKTGTDPIFGWVDGANSVRHVDLTTSEYGVPTGIPTTGALQALVEVTASGPIAWGRPVYVTPPSVTCAFPARDDTDDCMAAETSVDQTLTSTNTQLIMVDLDEISPTETDLRIKLDFHGENIAPINAAVTLLGWIGDDGSFQRPQRGPTMNPTLSANTPQSMSIEAIDGTPSRGGATKADAIWVRIGVAGTHGAGTIEVAGGTRALVFDADEAASNDVILATPGAGGTKSIELTFLGTGTITPTITVVGWFERSPSTSILWTTHGARYSPVHHAKLYNSYPYYSPRPSGWQAVLDVTGVAGVPERGVDSVMLSVQLFGTSGSVGVAAWPTGHPQPSGSQLVLEAGQQRGIANVLVPVGSDGKVNVKLTGTSTSDIQIGISGWFSAYAGNVGSGFPDQLNRPVATFGDSITAGAGEEILSSSQDTQLLSIYARGGHRVQQLQSWAEHTGRSRPDDVIINIGTNNAYLPDFHQGDLLEAYMVEQYTAMLDSLSSASCRYLVKTYENPANTQLGTTRGPQVNEAIQSIVDDPAMDAGLIDWNAYVTWYTTENPGGPVLYAASDTVHPTDEGEAHLAALYEAALLVNLDNLGITAPDPNAALLGYITACP